jgi:16S rRNA (uracil1498-N3)-methyltransferase
MHGPERRNGLGHNSAMPARLFVDAPLSAGEQLSLPAAAARHVQVLRLQPGAELTLFNGQGGQWQATVLSMGRSDVQVQVDAHEPREAELPLAITLALGMPANDRMDFLVEKATELGSANLQPLMTERSVLRLSGERAQRKQAHWQGIAVAACEQSGRNRVPAVGPVLSLSAWLQSLPPVAAPSEARWLLSPLAAEPLPQRAAAQAGLSACLVLSGPEGGLSPAEEALARQRGFAAVSLGPRVLRADTAPLAVCAWLGLQG